MGVIWVPVIKRRCTKWFCADQLVHTAAAVDLGQSPTFCPAALFPPFTSPHHGMRWCARQVASLRERVRVAEEAAERRAGDLKRLQQNAQVGGWVRGIR